MFELDNDYTIVTLNFVRIYSGVEYERRHCTVSFQLCRCGMRNWSARPHIGLNSASGTMDLKTCSDPSDKTWVFTGAGKMQMTKYCHSNRSK